MAKGIYIGVSSKARKVKKAYVGVEDKARKIKKGYIGVNGIARQFYPRLVPTTTAQLFFKLYDFANYLNPLSGVATALLQDGTRATLEFSTTANGFYKSTTSSGTRDNICAIIAGDSSTDVSDMNTVLLKTKSTTSTSTRISSGVDSGTASRTITFDFKTPRTLTLVTKVGNTSIKVRGSNDNVTWEHIAGAAAAKVCEAVSNTAYRYYRVEAEASRNLAIYYLYFENIQDWTEG